MDQTDEIRSKFGQLFAAFQKVQNTLMKIEELKTGTPIASPADPNRTWTVKPQTAVYPIIAPLKSRYRARDPELTNTAWIFQEASAHKLPNTFWTEVDVSMKSPPVFIEFIEPVFDAGDTLYGFVAPGDCLVVLAATASVKSLVGTAENPNKGIAATSFSKPQHKTVKFKSKSNPKKSYETIVYKDGTVSCNCPGWTKGGRSCKHTKDEKIKNIIDVMA